MNFLDKNGFRAALVIAILFLAMPFMFPERVPVDAKATAGDSSQPVKSKKFITGIYDRIGNFYSFKKTKKSSLDQTLEKLKKEADGTASADKKADSPAATQNSFDKSSADVSSSSAGASESSSFETGSSSSKLSYSAASAKASAKPRLSIGGKDYEVVKDLYGNDYAITGKGPVAVSSLLAKGGVLKYPSGKTVTAGNVSAEAYDAGGGANPYATSYASSKSSGSYKGGKRSGGVASTRKISSGFSLSGGGGKSGSSKRGNKGSGARPSYGGDFTGAVDIEDAYNSIQSKAVEARNDTYAAAETYYEPAYTPASPSAAPAPAAAPAAYAAIAPEILEKESMFESGTKASVRDTGETAVSLAKKVNSTIDLGDPTKPEPALAKPEPVKEAQQVKVNIDLNKGSGIIPKDKDVLQSMTNQLLGDNVEFESLPAGSKGSIKNPWVFPVAIPEADGKKEFSLAFWEENKDALAKAKTNKDGKSYSDPEIWKASDKSNYDVGQYIQSKKIPVNVVVLDGVGTGSQKNYFQQMANYLTRSTPNSKNTFNTIYVYKNESDLEGITSANLVKHPMRITPEDNKNFGLKLQSQVETIEKTKLSGVATKDVLKETRKAEAARIKKDVVQATEGIAKLKFKP